MPEHGKTPLDLAVENDHSDVVKLFLKHSSEISTLATCINIAAAKGNVVIIRELLMFHKSGLDILHNKKIALHLAAQNGHIHILEVLKSKVSLQVPGKKNKTDSTTCSSLFRTSGLCEGNSDPRAGHNQQRDVPQRHFENIG
ncbi:transient receptor potential cation channel, subfamily N, member 1 [Silurus meridionalis]|nr:transient receptor potential cation channel, subfamily N, member 1 [Silurus meridionalis]